MKKTKTKIICCGDIDFFLNNYKKIYKIANSFFTINSISSLQMHIKEEESTLDIYI